MKELLLIPIVHTSVFLLYNYLKYGMTKSISATYRNLEGWEKFWYTITMWLIAIPIMIVGIDSVPNNQPEILFFLAGSGICLVGASPKYWSGKMELTAHLIGSYNGIGISMIACVLYLFSPVVLILVASYLVFVIIQMFIKKLRIDNYVYWIEILALINISTILYLN